MMQNISCKDTKDYVKNNVDRFFKIKKNLQYYF